jgi:lipid-A-disaccharide synthase
MSGPYVWLCAGEASSDRIAADLMGELRTLAPGARFAGFGGERMVAAGLDQWYDLPRHSVMWVGQALRLMPEIYGQIRAAGRRWRADRPDAVVMVDNPGINFFFGRRARAAGIPAVYYVGPQVWAYNPWRIRKVRRWVDRMLVILPFEEPYYRQRGVEAAYVGNPLFAHLAAHPPDPVRVAALRAHGLPGGRVPPTRTPADAPLVGILPGSRVGEIRKNLPLQLRAAERLAGLLPGTRFVVSCAKPKLEPWIKQAFASTLVDPLLVPESSGEIYAAADVAIATSGTVTAEAVHHGTPVVIVYTVGPIAHAISRPWRVAPFVGLPNLLAGRSIVPEFVGFTDCSRAVAEAALTLLTDPRRRAQCIADLTAVRAAMLAVAHPSRRAAEAVLEALATQRPAAAG